LIMLFVGMIGIGAIRGAMSAATGLAENRRARLTAKLQKQISELHLEIAKLPSPRFTTESVPQRFPSKEAAQSFGQRWSRGGPESFSARAVDNNGNEENHPYFNQSGTAGGILYSAPALFFGMPEAYRDDGKWFLEFTRAKKAWLEDYLNQLRKGTPP